MQDTVVLRIARVAHEVNRAYCAALGDLTQPAWEDAPAWQVASAIQGVKLMANRPSVTPEASHENWMKEKEADGWTWGPVKNTAKKQHPCMVPFDELPGPQKAKDMIFTTLVRELLAFDENGGCQ